jgi:hypothetical protein
VDAAIVVTTLAAAAVVEARGNEIDALDARICGVGRRGKCEREDHDLQ